MNTIISGFYTFSPPLWNFFSHPPLILALLDIDALYRKVLFTSFMKDNQ